MGLDLEFPPKMLIYLVYIHFVSCLLSGVIRGHCGLSVAEL